MLVLDRARPRPPELQPHPHPGAGRGRGRGHAGGEERRLWPRARPDHGTSRRRGHPLGDGREAPRGRAAASRGDRVRGAGDGRAVLRRAVRPSRRTGADDGGVHRGGGTEARRRGTPPGTCRSGVREGGHGAAPGRRAPRSRAGPHRADRTDAECPRGRRVLELHAAPRPRPRDARALHGSVRRGRATWRRDTVPHHGQHQRHLPRPRRLARHGAPGDVPLRRPSVRRGRRLRGSNFARCSP